MKLEALLRSAGERWEIELSPRVVTLLARYLEILLKWNKRINVTGLKEPGGVIESLFMESLFPLKYVHFEDKKLLDVGSGAGFPGLVLKASIPSLDLTLIEPREKKVFFLEELIFQLKLEKVTIKRIRGEEFISNRRNERAYDIITVKGLDISSLDLSVCLESNSRFVHFTVKDKTHAGKSFALQNEVAVPFSRERCVRIYSLS